MHYCVANMPGGVPITSTKALTNATLPYVEAIADHGLAEAVARDPALARGVNVLDGKITYEAVAEAHGLEYTPLEDVLPLTAGLGPARRRSSASCGGEMRTTTSQVIPAASATMRGDEDDEAEESEDRAHAEPRIARCPAPAKSLRDRARRRRCRRAAGRRRVRRRGLEHARQRREGGRRPRPADLEALGLGNVEPLEGCPPQPGAPAVAGRLLERSKGKDTTTGPLGADGHRHAAGDARPTRTASRTT